MERYEGLPVACLKPSHQVHILWAVQETIHQGKDKDIVQTIIFLRGVPSKHSNREIVCHDIIIERGGSVFLAFLKFKCFFGLPIKFGLDTILKLVSHMTGKPSLYYIYYVILFRLFLPPPLSYCIIIGLTPYPLRIFFIHNFKRVKNLEWWNQSPFIQIHDKIFVFPG